MDSEFKGVGDHHVGFYPKSHSRTLHIAELMAIPHIYSVEIVGFIPLDFDNASDPRVVNARANVSRAIVFYLYGIVQTEFNTIKPCYCNRDIAVIQYKFSIGIICVLKLHAVLQLLKSFKFRRTRALPNSWLG